MRSSLLKASHWIDANIGALLLLPLFSHTFSPVLSPNFVLLVALLLLFARIIQGNVKDVVKAKSWIWREPFMLSLVAFMGMIVIYLFFSEKLARDVKLGFWNFIIPVFLCLGVYLLAKIDSADAILKNARTMAGFYIFTAACLAARLYFYIPVDYPLIQQAPTFDAAYNYLYNHGVIGLALVFFPVAMTVSASEELSKYEGIATLAVMFCATLIVLFLGDNHSARFAFLAGIFVLVLGYMFPRFVMTELFIFVPILLLIQPYWGQIIHLLFSDGDFRQFKVTFEFRSYIWLLFGEKIWEAPFLGHGIGTTEIFNFGDVIREKFRPDFNGGVHPHNNFLQVWYEFGLIGILLVLLMTISILKSIGDDRSIRKPYTLGFFVSAFVIALASHGLWQAWWISAVGIGVIMVALNSAAASTRHREST